MTQDSIDPTVELAHYRRHMLIYKVLTFVGLGLLICLDMKQSAQIDRQSEQLQADGHAISNLMEADRQLRESSDKLEQACSPLITPPPALAEDCRLDGDILICAGGTIR